MRIVNWNIEWMNNWFVGNGLVDWRNSRTGIASVAALAQRVANAILALDPDLVTIQEGPSDFREMELFVNGYLTNEGGDPLYQIFGGLDGGAQKIYALVKQDGALTDVQLAGDALTHGLFDEWLSDVDGDTVLEPYDFTRDPLVVDARVVATDEMVRVVSLHTKSKYVNQGRSLWTNPDRRHEFVVAALINRRRISSEAMRIRRYLSDLYVSDPQRLVVVTGDFNDGPGMDYFERSYLTHGVADIIVGSVYRSERQYRHPLIDLVPEEDRFTARFDDYVDEVNDRPLLLDHVLVSPALADRVTAARVAHAEWSAQEDVSRPIGDRDRHPSDHRPVVVEID